MEGFTGSGGILGLLVVDGERNLGRQLFTSHCVSISIFYQPALPLLCITPSISHSTQSRVNSVGQKEPSNPRTSPEPSNPRTSPEIPLHCVV